MQQALKVTGWIYLLLAVLVGAYGAYGKIPTTGDPSIGALAAGITVLVVIFPLAFILGVIGLISLLNSDSNPQKHRWFKILWLSGSIGLLIPIIFSTGTYAIALFG